MVFRQEGSILYLHMKTRDGGERSQNVIDDDYKMNIMAEVLVCQETREEIHKRHSMHHHSPTDKEEFSGQPEEECFAQRTGAGFRSLSSDSVEWLTRLEGRDKMRSSCFLSSSPLDVQTCH